MPAMPPPSVYEVGGPSTAAAEGRFFPLPAPGLPIPPSMIEDLSTRLGNLEYGHKRLVKKVQVMASQMVHAADPERRGDYRTDPAGAGFAGSSAAEGFADSAAADYGFGDEQPCSEVKLCGKVKLCGEVKLGREVKLCGEVKLCREVKLCGDVKLYGEGKLCRKVKLCVSEISISLVVYGFSPPKGSLLTSEVTLELGTRGVE
ncbi:hypothetical protein Tco_0087825 [Tanacetum coccineum]